MPEHARACQSMPISIHTLCEEGDFAKYCTLCNHSKFQSTPSVKRATYDDFKNHLHFCISIHTLCEEGDRVNQKNYKSYEKFQSTPSVKRATNKEDVELDIPIISIHTLCEEGDINIKITFFTFNYFNPHPL